MLKLYGVNQMTFEKDMEYADLVVDAVSCIIDNSICSNHDYRTVELRDYFEFFKNTKWFGSFYEKNQFCITMSSCNMIQININDDVCKFINFANLLNDTPSSIIADPSEYTEEHYFQESLMLDAGKQLDLLLVSKLRNYLKTTKYVSIEIMRDYLPILISDVKALRVASNDI